MTDTANAMTMTAQQSPASSALLSGYLTERELAHELGRDARTLKRWRAAREGPAWVAIGRKILYRRSAVQDWLASREVRPVRAASCRTARRRDAVR